MNEQKQYTLADIDLIFNTITERISNGESLRSVLKSDNMPSSRTFFKWIDKYENLNFKYNSSIKNILYIKNKRCKSNPIGSKAIKLNDYRIDNAKKTNSKRFPNSNIYLIKINNTNYYKIGVSQNYKRRFRDIENSMPFNIEIVLVKNIYKAYDMETKLHDIFKYKYIKSEWFELNNNDVIKIKNIINALPHMEVNNSNLLFTFN